MRFGDLPRPARVYVALVCALALGQAMLAATWQAAPFAPLELVVLLGLAAAWAHSFPVSTPGEQAYQVSLPFVIAATALLAPTQLIGLIAFVHLVDWLRHSHLRSRFALGFNAAVYISAGLLTQATYRWLWPSASLDLSQPACLSAGLAGVLVFLVQSRVLMSGAIWLGNRIAPREQYLFELDSLLTDSVLMAMGVPLAQLAISAPWAAAVSAAPLWLIHRVLDLPNVRAQRRQDGLTELFTAPYLTETTTRELNRARRFKRRIVLLLLDVDGLGRLNADYGHAAGDAVLRAAARTIKRATREYDLAARLAGGLFAVLLPETDLAQAQVVAERIRRDAATGHHEIPNSVEQVALTVSIGGAVFSGGSATANELFEAGRNALARAKRDGGNQIEFATLDAGNVAPPSVEHTGGTLIPLRARPPTRPAERRRTSPAITFARGVSLAVGLIAALVGLARLISPSTVADWRLLATLTCVAALAGLGFAFRNLTVALALAFELHIASARAVAARYWRLWPMYVALAAIGFVVAYAYQKFGLPVALGMAAAAIAFRHLASEYVDRTLESVRTLRTANEQLEHRAFHDPLTGLANRALFAERLEHALLRAETSSVAVLFLDLDNFKPVNDTLGHAAGDALLIAASQRLLHCVRREDSIARLGGDEFTVLLESMRDPSDAARLAERIGEALAEAFVISGQQVFVSSSIGIALDTDRSHRPDDLLREADLAMYRAKSGGKARYEIFDTGMGSRAMERLELETDLRRAAERGQLALVYVPLMDLDSDVSVDVEAALEWHHPRRGVLAQSEFGAVAEECDVAVEFACWAVQRACRDAASSAVRSVHVPISLRALEDPAALVAALRGAFAETQVSPARLCLGVPESALALDTDALQQLADTRVSLGVDALGSGALRLDRLTRSSIQVLKLAPDASSPVVRAAQALAAALDLRLVVAGDTSAASAAA